MQTQTGAITLGEWNQRVLQEMSGNFELNMEKTSLIHRKCDSIGPAPCEDPIAWQLRLSTE